VKEEFGLSMLLITHDLGVIAEMSDHVYVMYAGRIIEHGDIYGIFEDPVHPFTRAPGSTLTASSSSRFPGSCLSRLTTYPDAGFTRDVATSRKPAGRGGPC